MSATATCWKGLDSCKCRVGWPPEEQCADCREEQKRSSRCVCGSNDDIVSAPPGPTARQRLQRQLSTLMREHPACRTYNCSQCAEKLDLLEQIRTLEIE